jgi:hypothetical protein
MRCDHVLRDHCAETIAQGDLMGEVKHGLAASHVSLHPSRTRMYLPDRILGSSLRLAKSLRTKVTDTWEQYQSDTIILFRACLATVIMFMFFVAWEHEFNANMVTYCVHQPVESSFTTE